LDSLRRRGDDGLHLVLVYATDLFEGSTIDRTLGQFVRVMEGVVEDPDRRVVEIPLLTGRSGKGSWWDGTRRDGSIRGIGVSGSCSRSR